MDGKWPVRNAKDQFIEFCLSTSLGETTEELDELWGEYCDNLNKTMDKELPRDQG